jgi:hypothetical protein
MNPIRACALLASLALLSAAAGAQTSEPIDWAAFAQKVREAMRVDDELQRQFAYIEQRRDVRVTKLGKVEVGPQRTFEVYPSPEPGGTYKRLIAIEGKPLSPEELAKADRKHQQDLAREAERQKRESPKQRAERLEKEADEQRERNAIVADGFAVYEPSLVGRETLDGYELLVIALTPREDAKVTTRQGRWMKQFEGRVWISAADYQIVRLDMHARDDVTIGWGLLGRVHEGSRLVYKRRRFENAWLPEQLIFDASGRTLLFRTFDLDLVTTYSGYRRIGSR